MSAEDRLTSTEEDLVVVDVLQPKPPLPAGSDRAEDVAAALTRMRMVLEEVRDERWFSRKAADWSEEKHPRDPDGKFGDGIPNDAPSLVPTPVSVTSLDPDAPGNSAALASMIATAKQIAGSVDRNLENPAWREHVESLLPGLREEAKGPLQVAMPAGKVAALLKAKRFKSAHETTSTVGKGVPGYLKARKAYEEGVMGVSPDAPKKDRPIYGYVRHSRKGPANADYSPETKIGMHGYGRFSAVLKDDVKPRATVTFGDSLDGVLEPIPLADVESASTEQLLRARRNGDLMYSNDADFAETGTFPYLAKVNGGEERLSSGSYTEVQVHGGIALSDVESWRVTRSFLEDKLGGGPTVSAAAAAELAEIDATIALLEKAGHRVEVL